MTTCRHHDWQPTDTGWACAACDTTTPACGTCAGPVGTSLLVCDPCLDRERNILRDIETARDRIAPDPHSPVRSPAYDLANTRGDGSENLPFDLDRFVDDWALGIPGIKTPDGVDELLWEWVARWTDATGEAQNVSAADYLSGHLLWAAHNPEASGWEEYRAEMRDLLARARSLDPARPQRTGETCLDCGGHLVRHWRRDGLGDTVTCQVCTRVYDMTSYRLAVRARYERAAHADPEALVTEQEAARMFGLGTSTLRVWAHRGQIARVATGPARYRLGDVHRLATADTHEEGVAEAG